MYVSQINTSSPEGMLLMAALAIESGPQRNPEREVPIVIEETLEMYEKTAKHMYDESFEQMMELREELSKPLTFEQKIEKAINQHSIENESNTPDFILASYVRKCLTAFAETSREREMWYGKELKII